MTKPQLDELKLLCEKLNEEKKHLVQPEKFLFQMSEAIPKLIERIEELEWFVTQVNEYVLPGQYDSEDAALILFANNIKRIEKLEQMVNHPRLVETINRSINWFISKGLGRCAGVGILRDALKATGSKEMLQYTNEEILELEKQAKENIDSLPHIKAKPTKEEMTQRIAMLEKALKEIQERARSCHYCGSDEIAREALKT